MGREVGVGDTQCRHCDQTDQKNGKGRPPAQDADFHMHSFSRFEIRTLTENVRRFPERATNVAIVKRLLGRWHRRWWMGWMVTRMVIRGWRNSHIQVRRAIPVFGVPFRHPTRNPSVWTFRLASKCRAECSHLACGISFTIRMAVHSPSPGMASHCRGHPFAILGCDKWPVHQTWTWKLQALRRRTPVSH